MKKLLTYTFIGLYVLAMLRPVAPMLDYVINQDYIKEFLCINKDNTALQCNGKCYLMQQLQKQNDDKKHNLPRIAMEEYPIGFVSIVKISSKEETTTIYKHNFKYQNLYQFLNDKSSFRPPTIS